MCGKKKQLAERMKTQPVVVTARIGYKRLLKRAAPVRLYRRKHGANRGNSGRFPKEISKIPIDKKRRFE